MRFIKRTVEKSIAPKSLDMDAAKKLLDTSAEKNRKLLVAFMAYLATATVLALSITDLDLLLNQKSIQLPQLSVPLPIWAFYTLIPLLLVLLHFNVLQNVQEHNRKRDAWLAHKPIDPGTQILSNPLDIARVRYGIEAAPSAASMLVAASAWVIYVYLPLLVLVIFFIRFADLQGIATSSWHLALGAIDIYFLSQFWQSLRDSEQPPVHSAKWLSRSGLGLLGFVVLWTLTLFSYIQILHFDPSYSQKPIKDAIALENTLRSIGSIAIVPRILAPDARPYQAAKDEDIRLDWSGKRLAFANLQNSQLPHIDLPNADLQGADLRKAQLQDTDLRQVLLRGANLSFIQSHDTNLVYTRPQDRDPTPFTQRQEGADLSEANLQSADLSEANLQGANLSKAQLQDANLSKAKLQGANLSKAKLQGVDLDFARLQGADLRKAQLQDADLSHASLQGAIFEGAQLQGANLDYAQLQGANLWGAQLQGAKLLKAQLQGAYLDYAHLHGAYLTGAQLQGANLFAAQLQGAYLIGAQLQGADLYGAQLQGADLSSAKVQGVNWKDSNTEGMLALGLDNSTRFDFASYVAKSPPISSYFEERMDEAAGRQDNPPSVPRPLGTQDPTVYKKTWLSLLCQSHHRHRGMLISYWIVDPAERLIPKQVVLDYVDQTPRCEPYRTITVPLTP